MTIEFWKGGWYVVNGPDPVTIKEGPCVTFQEAYDVLDKLKQKETR